VHFKQIDVCVHALFIYIYILVRKKQLCNAL